MILTKNKGYFYGVLCLLFITILLRFPTFFLPHNNNDELIHLSLAMKIDEYGLDVFGKEKYNLFYVDVGLDRNKTLIGVKEGKEKIGSLLKGFLGERRTLSHHPPFLPFLISLSHKIFANSSGYFVSISKNLYLMARNATIQFYACYIPFLFSILLVLSVYILGNMLFSHRVGLISAFFLSLTPAELMTANKIWADDMTAFFVVLAVILYLHALKNNKPLFSLLSGMSCGFSILTKMIGIYLIFVVLLFHLFEQRNKKVNTENLKSFLFDRKILYFLAGIFVVSAWWFYLYYSEISLLSMKNFFMISPVSEQVTNWNTFFNRAYLRPWFSYFILVPFQTPFYFLSYIFIPLFILRKRIKIIKELTIKDYRFLQFLIIWVLVSFTLLTLKSGKELRYMLIAYPAISILSAYCLNSLYEWMKIKKVGLSARLQNLFFVSIILASLLFSLKIALPRVLSRADIIPIPF